MSDLAPSTAALQVLTSAQAWHYRALPLTLEGRTLAVALSPDPERDRCADELAVLTGLAIRVVDADSAALQPALSRFYRDGADTPTASLSGRGDFIAQLLEEALRMRASDIHIEPRKTDARVRLRVDGALLERFELERDDYARYVNQIKVRSELDISQRMLPQDGRLQHASADGRAVDVRVSTLPSLHGEKVVMRLLGTSAVELDLERLGMTERQLLDFRRGIDTREGIVVVSGPTGSGKTTSLYGTLNYLNTVDVNIVTAEDPIEYTLPGIVQVQTHEAVGLSFARALEAFLRQDPDIIMLGEIRNQETAQIAIRASLSGHLVLATLHTNSALGIVGRLQDMGVAPYKLADTLTTLVAQRLLRRLCTSCRTPTDETDPRRRRLLSDATPYVPTGCPACHHTGYLGRVAVHEVIAVDGALRSAIRAGHLTEESRPDGVDSLATRALDLVRTGVTSWAEANSLLLDLA